MNWFNDLSTLQQVYFVIAILSTFVLGFQMLMLFFGLNNDSDLAPETDFDASSDLDHGISGLQVLSVRGIISFLIITGWSGFALGGTEMHGAFVSLIAVFLGFLSLISNALIMKEAAKLQQSGNSNILNSVNKIGTVYIPIPPKDQGSGKIQVTFEQRLTELDAINSENTALKTGMLVKIIGIFDENTVIVKKE